MRLAVLAYGIVAYVCFVGSFTYAMGFAANLGVPKTIDVGGPETPVGLAILINALLLLVFAVQHTIMARPAFKRWIARFIPEAAERSTFVLFASAALGLILWQWRPIAIDIWRAESDAIRLAITGVCALGFVIVLYSSFLIDHFDLFGLRQAWLYFQGRPYTHRPFAERSLYRRVRHPLMLGFLIAFWATPHMTIGHLVFALLVTAYILVGIRFEERDLVRALGQTYVDYRERTPALIPRLGRAGRGRADEVPALQREVG